VVVRPVAPGDLDALDALDALMSSLDDQSRYRRWFTARPTSTGPRRGRRTPSARTPSGSSQLNTDRAATGS